MRRELANIAFVSLLLAGCGRPDRPQNTKVIPPSNVRGAPRYIPAEQLPIRQVGVGFIEYNGDPSLEHLNYLRSVCGELTPSAKSPIVIIGTPETPDCVDKIKSRRP